jgi:hypothetical protein
MQGDRYHIIMHENGQVRLVRLVCLQTDNFRFVS